MLLLEEVVVEAGGRRLLDHVDLSVRRGELVSGVLEDPAGRQAVVELLLGRRAPDRGRVRIDGSDPVRDRDHLAHRIAVVRVAVVDVRSCGDAQKLSDLAREAGADVWVVDDESDRPEPGPLARFATELVTLHATRRPTALVLTRNRELARSLPGRVAWLTNPPGAPDGARTDRPHP